jgi:hypothetical protein
VKELCGGFYPDVALVMFAKESPWTRAYLTRDVQAWNASGGASSADKLVFDEEVLVLFHREVDQGGVVVSGASGGYDVLRWDGSCASLAGEELTQKRPPKAKSARIVWKSLSLAKRARRRRARRREAGGPEKGVQRRDVRERERQMRARRCGPRAGRRRVRARRRKRTQPRHAAVMGR